MIWRPSKGDLSLFFRQFAALFRAGIALDRAFDTMSGQTGHPFLKRISKEGMAQSAGGESLSGIFSRFPDAFSPEIRALVEAGEKAGTLDSALERLAGYLENAYRTDMEIRSQTFYPKLVAVLAFLIPMVPRVVLEGIQAGIAYLAALLAGALIIMGIYSLLKLLCSAPSFAQSLDGLKLSLPLVGKIVRMTASARFARTLAELYKAGLPLDRGLKLAGEATGNAAFSRMGAQLSASFLEKGGLRRAFQEQGRELSPAVLNMMATAEKTGELDKVMDSAAGQLEMESHYGTKKLVALLNPLLVALSALLVLHQLMGIMGSRFETLNQIRNLAP
ncbi:MAG: type II secretion system F family protein [Armatimonadetes bacterium]|nr:type II secretion system F family protein [Armatimonadota bacterium]